MMVRSISAGERWIRLLRGYAPVPENEAQQAERVDRLAQRYGLDRIRFVHPWHDRLIGDFLPVTGEFNNTILTGTAGDGKTALCLELMQHLTGEKATTTGGEQTVNCETADGVRSVTFILDVTAWRRRDGNSLAPEHVALVERLAASVFGQSEETFVLAVNDGQMHELFRLLPSSVSDNVVRLREEVVRLHASAEEKGLHRLRLLNLSRVESDQLMALCLDAVLCRPEWHRAFADEDTSPHFCPSSSIRRNFDALNRPETRERLMTLAKVADATGHHLPIRGILCLLANALLGHPDAKGGVLRVDDSSRTVLRRESPERAAIHRTLFGENLSSGQRSKREIYRFLSKLKVGDETTNDLDELLIFGAFDQELKEEHSKLVLHDPFFQRSSTFDRLVARYIQGEISTDAENLEFLRELTSERRRIFLQASDAETSQYDLWCTTVFRSAGTYLVDVLERLRKNESIRRPLLRRLVTGLNRVWTGLLVSDSCHALYLTTGLDVTTSPISDVLLETLDLDADPPNVDLRLSARDEMPEMVIRTRAKEFAMALTLPRFEFLTRVSAGAMPSSFSKERSADLMAQKPACLAALGIRSGEKTLFVMSLDSEGSVRKRPVSVMAS